MTTITARLYTLFIIAFLLVASQPVFSDSISVSEGYVNESIAKAKAKQKNTLRNRNDVYGDIELYSVYTRLNHDYDHDGFYTQVETSFDLDVSYGTAYVYVELWIRDQHGYYEHLHTSHDFSIEGNTSFDEYVITTNLLSDYAEGYYNLLIEVFDASSYSNNPVASADERFYPSLSALPLESDEYQGSSSVSLEVAAVGANFALLPLLLLLALIRLKDLK